MPDLNLIDPSDEFGSASSYSSPNFSATSPSSGGGGIMYASMGLSAIGAIVSGFEQSNAYKSQGVVEASIAATNAKIADLQSSEVLEEGDIAASRIDQRERQVEGSTLASQGASGTDVASGSNALVRNAERLSGAQDQLTVRNNAQRQAWGYKMQATADAYRGQFAQLTAKTESEQTLLNSGLKAISGPLGIESNYLRWSRSMGGNASAPFPGVN